MRYVQDRRHGGYRVRRHEELRVLGLHQGHHEHCRFRRHRRQRPLTGAHRREDHRRRRGIPRRPRAGGNRRRKDARQHLQLRVLRLYRLPIPLRGGNRPLRREDLRQDRGRRRNRGILPWRRLRQHLQGRRFRCSGEHDGRHRGIPARVVDERLGRLDRDRLRLQR